MSQFAWWLVNTRDHIHNVILCSFAFVWKMAIYFSMGNKVIIYNNISHGILGVKCYLLSFPDNIYDEWLSFSGLWKTVDRPFYKLTFYNIDSTWQGAISFCKNKGSSLVQLDDSSVNYDVINTVKRWRFISSRHLLSSPW